MVNYPLGMRGNFKGLAPFATVIPTNVVLTVDSVRSLSSIAADGIDGYTVYYQPYTLTADNYSDDLKNGVVLIGLTAGNGIRYDVPSSYLDRIPNVSGVAYTHMALIVDLGVLPDLLSLSPVITRIKNVCTESLGIQATVTPAALTPKMLVDHALHDSNEASRRAVVTNYTTNEGAVHDLQLALANAQKQIAALQNYIKAHP